MSPPRKAIHALLRCSVMPSGYGPPGAFRRQRASPPTAGSSEAPDWEIHTRPALVQLPIPANLFKILSLYEPGLEVATTW